MQRRVWVGLLALVVLCGAVVAQISMAQRAAASSHLILQASIRSETLRRHDFRRLPRYALTLRVEPSLDAFTGEETLAFANTTGATLTELVFHLYPNAKFMTERGRPNLTIAEATINGGKATYTAEGDVLHVALPTSLAPGQQAQAGLKFLGKVPRVLTVRSDSIISLLRDLLRVMLKRDNNYGIYALGDGVLNLGHWFPILAHHDGKSWDTEGAVGVGDIAHFDIANYDVTIEAPSDAKIVATGVAQSEEVRESRRHTRYYAGAVRDFAVQISPRYMKATRSVDGVAVNSIYLPEHRAAGERALDVAAKSLAYFNRTVGAYPYLELDVVEAPLATVVGGMEHPGLVTINHLLYDLGNFKSAEKTGDQDLDAMLGHLEGLNERMLAFVIIHEVAHQWWNATVGSDSKTHPFLDEALANHSARMGLEAIMGLKAAEEQAFLNIELTYHLHRAMGGKDRAIDLPAKAYGSTTEYAAIVYGKGALFFRALEEQMGRERFTKMLQRYYERGQFRIASPQDLLTAAKEVSADPIKTQVTFRRWLAEARADDDIGPIRLSRAFEALVAPLLAKDAAETSFLRNLTKGLDEILSDARTGKKDLLDSLLGELDAALTGKPTKTTNGLGSLFKAFDELLKALDSAGK